MKLLISSSRKTLSPISTVRNDDDDDDDAVLTHVTRSCPEDPGTRQGTRNGGNLLVRGRPSQRAGSNAYPRNLQVEDDGGERILTVRRRVGEQQVAQSA